MRTKQVSALHILMLIFTFCILPQAQAESDILDKTVNFFEWLEKHTKDFAQCEPRKQGAYYELCDKTRVDTKDLKNLFQMKPEELVHELESRGLKVEILCDATHGQEFFKEQCVATSQRKMFQEISSLHGTYLSAEKTILVRSSATPGSMIHEYIHSLQSNNTHAVFGKVYKKERNQLQVELTERMNQKIAAIETLKKNGQNERAKPQLQEFMILSQMIRGFAPWQDLIDERGIFLLYLKYGKEFGANASDFDIAHKNMGFICKNEKLKKILPAIQCRL